MDNYTVIEEDADWDSWVYENYPEIWMIINNRPVKYPCLVKEAGQQSDGDDVNIFVSITYIEEAKALIALLLGG